MRVFVVVGGVDHLANVGRVAVGQAFQRAAAHVAELQRAEPGRVQGVFGLLGVRGADLRLSTPVQRVLQRLLGLPEPTYLHHPLVTYLDGRRLAKRDRAPTLQAMREDGIDGPALAESLRKGSLPYGFRLANA